MTSSDLEIVECPGDVVQTLAVDLPLDGGCLLPTSHEVFQQGLHVLHSTNTTTILTAYFSLNRLFQNRYFQNCYFAEKLSSNFDFRDVLKRKKIIQILQEKLEFLLSSNVWFYNPHFLIKKHENLGSKK